MRVYIGKATDVGRLRTQNEDDLYVDHQNGCFVVADGVGGYESGEVASRIVVSTIKQFITRSKSDYGERKNALIRAIESANYKILKIASSQKKRVMGATATALLIGPVNYCIAHVGDCRAYLIRGGTIQQITKDHSYVQTLVDNGIITPAEARTHERRNEIMRGVGFTSEINIDIYENELRETDAILLCSDGLWGEVSDQAILETVLNSDNPQDACNTLITLANNNGGHDNITVILVQSSPTMKKFVSRKRFFTKKRFITSQLKKQILKIGVIALITVSVSLIIVRFSTNSTKNNSLWINIITSPDTLNVRINKSSEYFRIVKSKSLKVKIRDTLEFSKTGYYSHYEIIEPGKKNYFIELKQKFANVIFSINPPSASIFLKNTNRKLLNNDSLPYGFHPIRIECPGYIPIETIIQINDNKLMSFNFVLEKKETVIKSVLVRFSGYEQKDGKIDSDIMGAELFINNNYKGTIPCNVTLIRGERYIATLKKNGKIIAERELKELLHTNKTDCTYWGNSFKKIK